MSVVHAEKINNNTNNKSFGRDGVSQMRKKDSVTGNETQTKELYDTKRTGTLSGRKAQSA